MTKKRIQLVYGIVLSVSLVIAGLCLIVACVGIYRMGDHPFSQEAVAAAFDTVDIPVYLSLVLILGKIVLDIFIPVESEKKPIEKQYSVILSRQLAMLDLEQCEPTLRSGILQEETKRKIHKTVALVLLGVCSVGFLFYGLRIENFPLGEGITPAMVSAMRLFIPCLALPFGYGIFTAYYTKSSMRREIELVKQARAAGCPAPAKQTQAPPRKNLLPVVKTAVVVIAVGLLLFGLLNGGTKDVLTKAVNICTECVGLG